MSNKVDIMGGKLQCTFHPGQRTELAEPYNGEWWPIQFCDHLSQMAEHIAKSIAFSSLTMDEVAPPRSVRNERH